MIKKLLITSGISILVSNLAYAEVTRDLLEENISVETSDVNKTDNLIRESINLKSVQKAFLDNNSESSVINVRYKNNEEVKVRLRVNTNTVIKLPLAEEIDTFILGDTESFSGHILPNHKNIFVVKAFDAGADTSLHLVTRSGNTYLFYLFSTGVDYEKKPYLTVQVNNDDNFVLNQGELKEDSSQARKGISNERYDFVKSIPDPKKIYKHYKIRGNKEIAPYAAYDDGKWTYFDFRVNLESGQLPAVFKVVNKYEKPQDSNSVMENGVMIVKSVSKEPWVLRYDDYVVCIKRY